MFMCNCNQSIDVVNGPHRSLWFSAERRLTNTAGNDHKVNKTNVLPVVLVRDPYSWMQSMVSIRFKVRRQVMRFVVVAHH